MRKKSRIGVKERIVRGIAKARLAWRKWNRVADGEKIIDDMLRHIKKASETRKPSDAKTAIKKIREAVKAIDALKQIFERKGLKKEAEEAEEHKQKARKLLKSWIMIHKKTLAEESKKMREKYREN